jgi:hypothetical protein
MLSTVGGLGYITRGDLDLFSCLQSYGNMHSISDFVLWEMGNCRLTSQEGLSMGNQLADNQ